MKKLLLFVLSLLICLTGCRVADLRVMSVAVPEMKSEADVQKINKALSQLNGIERETVVFDIERGQITLSYDSMQLGHKNIEITIAEAGYNANQIKAIAPPDHGRGQK